jgi:hypothetical protein
MRSYENEQDEERRFAIQENLELWAARYVREIREKAKECGQDEDHTDREGLIALADLIEDGVEEIGSKQ